MVWGQRELRQSGLQCVPRQLDLVLWRWSDLDPDAERFWCRAYLLGDPGELAVPLWALFPHLQTGDDDNDTFLTNTGG